MSASPMVAQSGEMPAAQQEEWAALAVEIAALEGVSFGEAFRKALELLPALTDYARRWDAQHAAQMVDALTIEVGK